MSLGDRNEGSLFLSELSCSCGTNNSISRHTHTSVWVNRYGRTEEEIPAISYVYTYVSYQTLDVHTDTVS